MKKTILSILASFVAVSGAFGQVAVAWLANRLNPVSYSLDGLTSNLFPAGTLATVPAGSGAYSGQLLNVDFFAAPLGTPLHLGGPFNLPDFTLWTPVGIDLHEIIPRPGWARATVVLPPSFAVGVNVPVEYVQFEVVGWTGTATTWAQALIDGNGLFGYSGETFNGALVGALGWEQLAGNEGAMPVPVTPGAVTTGENGYAGLILQPVPEPATIALGGLGTAAFLLFRRRK